MIYTARSLRLVNDGTQSRIVAVLENGSALCIELSKSTVLSLARDAVDMVLSDAFIREKQNV